MQTATAAALAARAAAERAQQCHRRATQLAHRRPIGPADVAYARASLSHAIIRELVARARLEAVQHRQLSRTSQSPALHDKPTSAVPATSTIRELARAVEPDTLYARYFELGGIASVFDVDAFVHDLVDLPDGQAAILAQAVWEITELPD